MVLMLRKKHGLKRDLFKSKAVKYGKQVLIGMKIFNDGVTVPNSNDDLSLLVRNRLRQARRQRCRVYDIV